MQTVLVNIPFADLEALVDSTIQMEGKLHQANENRKRRMMNQNGPHHTQKYRNNSSGGFTPRYNKPPAQNYRPNYPNNNGGPPKPGGNNNNNHHNNNHPNSNNNNGNNNNANTAPRTGSNATPVTPKDKATINCYECGVVGHYSNECPKKLAKIAANTAAPAKCRFAGRRNQNNNNGRLYHMTTTEAQEAPQTMPKMASPINFNQFLEKEKLKSNGRNFTDWFRHVRIFLSGGNLQYVLDAPLGDPPAKTETDEVKAVYETRKIRYSQVQCAILCSLESDLQKRFEHHDPHELMKELKAIFETHAAVECYEASKQFFSCMMEEGSSVSEHMLAMTGHAKKLSDLGIVIPNRLGINRVLQSLPPSYKNFVMNYNMQNMNKELPELFGMLKAAEIEIKKEHQVLMVNKTTSFKKQGKSKGKFKKGGKKAATPPVKPKNGPKPDAECYYWRRDTGSVIAPNIWLI
ncbi:hypothetical protein QYE76_049833 [Lolium multiflorum]|uniref:CCHC-type domain-containing protein n=1 Tax=Lolium multiflorum TaxID=4521 RepID=A0AAD8WGP0_LOLMU|nr:hypothetical protein QYE76_049833 [Lolium multiflorum]